MEKEEVEKIVQAFPIDQFYCPLIEILEQEAIATEEMRIKHALEASGRRIEGFEKKYMISSETFIKE